MSEPSDFDEKGRFAKGNTVAKLGGRPRGALAKLSRSVRDRVLDGIGDVEKFVHELKISHPPAAAGLLARLLPPGDAPDPSAGGTVVIQVLPIARGNFCPRRIARTFVKDATLWGRC